MPDQQATKPFYLSKTLWLQLLAIVAIFLPKSAQFIQDNFQGAGAAFVALNFFLRLISKNKLEIS